MLTHQVQSKTIEIFKYMQDKYCIDIIGGNINSLCYPGKTGRGIFLPCLCNFKNSHQIDTHGYICITTLRKVNVL